MSADLRLQHALNSPRINTMGIEELTPAVSGLIQQVCVMGGYHLPGAAELSILTAKLTTDLHELYGGLTLPEISLCFEYGVKGDYEEFVGLNMRTFSRWLKAYRRSDRRYQAVMQREKECERIALPPVSEAYKEERSRVFMERIFRQYRTGVPLERLFPAQVYRMLQERGLICDSPAVKWRAMEEAAVKYAPRAGLYLPEDRRQVLIRQEAMSICLCNYFDRLIEQGQQSLFNQTQAEAG